MKKIIISLILAFLPLSVGAVSFVHTNGVPGLPTGQMAWTGTDNSGNVVTISGAVYGMNSAGYDYALVYPQNYPISGLNGYQLNSMRFMWFYFQPSQFADTPDKKTIVSFTNGQYCWNSYCHDIDPYFYFQSGSLFYEYGVNGIRKTLLLLDNIQSTSEPFVIYMDTMGGIIPNGSSYWDGRAYYNARFTRPTSINNQSTYLTIVNSSNTIFQTALSSNVLGFVNWYNFDTLCSSWDFSTQGMQSGLCSGQDYRTFSAVGYPVLSYNTQSFSYDFSKFQNKVYTLSPEEQYRFWNDLYVRTISVSADVLGSSWSQKNNGNGTGSINGSYGTGQANSGSYISILDNPVPVAPTCSFSDSFLGLGCLSDWIGYGYDKTVYSIKELANAIIRGFNYIIQSFADLILSIVNLPSKIFSMLFDTGFIFSGQTTECYYGTGNTILSSSGSLPFTQKLINLVSIFDPTAPADNANVCTLSRGTVKIEYSRPFSSGPSTFDLLVILFSLLPILLVGQSNKND